MINHIFQSKGNSDRKRPHLPLLISTLLLALAPALHAETGVTSDKIVIGGVLDLEGRSSGLGKGMKAGILAAIDGKTVKGRRIEYVTLNDSYTPDKTISATQDLVDRGIFAMVGNVGTPTAKVSLPILARNNVPAVGFFTGAGILRPGEGDIINYRASYVQETAAVIDTALDAGLKPNEICAYVQNDAYGMAGIAGIRAALSKRGGARDIIAKLDSIVAQIGENPPRNDIGPVGVYQRNTFVSRDGYESLSNWQTKQNTKCRLVITVGTYNAVARFAGYAKLKGEDWLFSAVSFTGADDLRDALSEFGVTSNVIVTEVVPPSNSELQIIDEAKRALGKGYSNVSLEGYIVGKLVLAALQSTPGEITRRGFIETIKGNTFDIGGVKLDFTSDNQGSDLVVLTYLDGTQYHAINADDLKQVLR